MGPMPTAFAPPGRMVATPSKTREKGKARENLRNARCANDGRSSSTKSKKHVLTTPDPTDEVWRCRVTHPFHPWKGRVLEVFEHRQDWNGDRVYFHDEGGCLRSVPAGWTDIAGADPLEVMGKGRARFRIDDLIRLVELIETYTSATSSTKETTL